MTVHIKGWLAIRIEILYYKFHEETKSQFYCFSLMVWSVWLAKMHDFRHGHACIHHEREKDFMFFIILLVTGKLKLIAGNFRWSHCKAWSRFLLVGWRRGWFEARNQNLWIYKLCQTFHCQLQWHLIIYHWFHKLNSRQHSKDLKKIHLHGHPIRWRMMLYL